MGHTDNVQCHLRRPVAHIASNALNITLKVVFVRHSYKANRLAAQVVLVVVLVSIIVSGCRWWLIHLVGLMALPWHSRKRKPRRRQDGQPYGAWAWCTVLHGATVLFGEKAWRTSSNVCIIDSEEGK